MRAPHRVVVIDDAEHIRHLLRVLVDIDDRFEWTGEAANGTDGIALVRDVAPDAVVLDYEMPDIDGVEVLRTIRASGSSAVVVLYTSSEAARPEAMRSGADATFAKGDPLKQVLDAVAALADERT